MQSALDLCILILRRGRKGNWGQEKIAIQQFFLRAQNQAFLCGKN